MFKSILLSSLIVNLGLLLGRLAGFLREIIIASEFGAGADADLIVLILTIPDLLINILIGGGLAAALIPEFIQCANSERKKVLIFQSLFSFFILSVAITCLFFLFGPNVLKIFVPGFNDLQIDRTLQLYHLIIWLMPLTVISGVLTSYLHAHNRFLSASMGTLIINFFVILGLLVSVRSISGEVSLVFFVLLGGVARVAFQYSEVKFKLLSPLVRFRPWLISRDVFFRYFQVALSGSLLLCFPIVLRAYSTYLGEGYLSIFNYSMKLVELPQVFFIGFVAVVLFPKVSSSYKNDPGLFVKLSTWGFLFSFLLSSLCVAVVLSISDILVDFVFGYGSMNINDVSKLSNIFCLLALSLPFVGGATYLMMIFNSMKKTKIPLYINLVVLFFFIALVEFLPNSESVLALSFVFSNVLSFILGLIALSYIDFKLFSRMLIYQYHLVIIVSAIALYLIVTFISDLFSNNIVIVVLSSFAFVLVTAGSFFTVSEFRVFIKSKVFKNA